MLRGPFDERFGVGGDWSGRRILHMWENCVEHRPGVLGQIGHELTEFAVEVAKDADAITIGFSGYDGGKLAPAVDISVHIPSFNMAMVEDVHLMLEHAICERLLAVNQEAAAAMLGKGMVTYQSGGRALPVDVVLISEANDILKKYADCYAQGMNIVNLMVLQNLGK
jgi:hypothetical protein